MHMANRCILAQDQVLYWADSEITYLRWKWDRCLQELSARLPLKKRPRLRAETFELPPTLLPRLLSYPRGSQDTAEMDRALRDTCDYYGGPAIRMPGYPGAYSPPFYSVPPNSSPEAPQSTP
jgi:hypothetical protein